MRGCRERRTALLLSLAVVASCRTRSTPDPSGIALRVEVTPSTVAAGSPFSVAYLWALEANPPPPGDWRAFVHFVDRDGIVLFTDDHLPSPPPASWRPGGRYSYRRSVFARVVPYTGKVDVVAGLFQVAGGQRLPLRGEATGRREYRVGGLDLAIERSAWAPRFQRGFFPPKAPAAAPFEVSRWMREEGLAAFPNPRTDAALFLEADFGGAVTDPPILEIETPAGAAAKIVTEGVGVFRRAALLPAAALGTDDLVTLRLRVSRALPSSGAGKGGDTRELGLRLFHLSLVPARDLAPALLEGAFPVGSGVAQ